MDRNSCFFFEKADGLDCFNAGKGPQASQLRNNIKSSSLRHVFHIC